ncbi:MAG: hypothetical protein KKF24_08740, partial [Gammaproteobacteria bacterium]|nr:hypothetical protein [Gammaproteobacteria bacterium]
VKLDSHSESLKGVFWPLFRFCHICFSFPFPSAQLLLRIPALVKQLQTLLLAAIRWHGFCSSVGIEAINRRYFTIMVHL